jgi:voltage-gated potassium channel Kch
MSKGAIALIGGLALVSLSFVLLMSAVVTITGIAPAQSDRFNPFEAMWQVLVRALDSGTVSGDTGWKFRAAMLFVTFGGIFMIGTLIGLLSNGINVKLEALRKGRSRVIETDHIVILGWSPQIFTLISELTLANANRPDTCIVILSEEDKVLMEDTLSEVLGKLRRVRLVCRTGSPSSMADLGMVSIQATRSIIILNSSDDADIQLVKTLLAITNIPRSFPTPYHIVARVQNSKTLDIIQIIGRDLVEILLVQDLISRIVVQTCRQSGLSIVYLDLLDFDGNEIYFKAEPSLTDWTYGQALLAYNNSVVIGIKYLDGTIHLNPPINTLIQAGVELILISEDDDKIHLSEIVKPAIDTGAIRLKEPNLVTAENTLILGWNDRVPFIIQLLDSYVIPGSSITIVAKFPETEVNLSPESLGLQHQTLDYCQGDTTDRQLLENLQIGRYNHIIVLSNMDLELEKSDAQTLMTLLQLRHIANCHNYNIQVVTEILDVRNQALAQVARPNDFVIGEQIISRMLAQVAEQKHLNAVFADLFSSEGSEIYLKPVSNYIEIDRPVNFYTVVEAAKQCGESAIGYRCQADVSNKAKSYGIVVNPQKDLLITFAPNDVLIVLAEN